MVRPPHQRLQRFRFSSAQTFMAGDPARAERRPCVPDLRPPESPRPRPAGLAPHRPHPDRERPPGLAAGRCAPVVWANFDALVAAN
jgi:hypothetical protein